VGVDAQCRIVLVIPEDDIIAGTVLLDEAGFQEERFFFVRGYQAFDVSGFSQEHAGLEISGCRLAQVAADAFAQVLGLAHVENAAVSVLKEIDSRQMRHGCHLRGKRR